MLIVDALVILGVISCIAWLITLGLRNRAKRLELRESREFQLKQLVAAREVLSLLLLDEDNAVKVFQQLEKELSARGKLLPR